MFKIIECDQRSEEWRQARLGKWTGSNFGNLITKKGAPSATAKTINSKLIAEIITGKPSDSFTSDAMERGKELEQEAMFFLSQAIGIEFSEVGFVDSEEGYGVSPDGINLALKTGCEIKCPLAHTHVDYLLSNEVPEKYMAQIQGAMLVTGFKDWWFISYHPDLPPLIKKVERDEVFINNLKKALIQNCNTVKVAVQKIRGMEI